MYSYTPHKKSLSSYVSLSQFRPKRVGFSVAKTVVFFVLTIFGAIAAWQLPNRLVYARQVATIPKPEERVLPAYRKHVATLTDVNKLAQMGNNLLSKNMPLYAAEDFKQASNLDPNYRDAAYGWGYASLMAKGPALTEDDFKTINTAIARAEAVDPDYVPLLQLKLIVAKLEHKEDVIAATQKRIDLLEKN